MGLAFTSTNTVALLLKTILQAVIMVAWHRAPVVQLEAASSTRARQTLGVLK